jgi:hypothetical protein
VLTGSHPAARLRGAGATHVLASVADLPGVLAGIVEADAGGGRAVVPPPASEGMTGVESARGNQVAQGDLGDRAQESIRHLGPGGQ